jgi:hypothetical protein
LLGRAWRTDDLTDVVDAWVVRIGYIDFLLLFRWLVIWRRHIRRV